MNSSFQDRIQLEERKLESYREQHFCGSARVHLNCLAFDNGFDGHMDDGRNVTRLEHILKIQGCLRIHRDYHVPVLVDVADWGHRVKFVETEAETFPELYVPLGESLRAQRHRSIISAARKMLKSPRDQWWIVDVYVADQTGGASNSSEVGHNREVQHLQFRFLRSLREPCLVDCQPVDGLIYYNIRRFQGNHDGMLPDKSAECDWWVILRANATSRKHEYLRRFFHHGSFPQAFDTLLPLPGIWFQMSIGVLHSLIALRCDEEVLDYVEHIRHTWLDRILGGDASLAAHADAITVNKLQSRVPMVSSCDLESLSSSPEQEDLKEDLFPSLCDNAKRKAIWDRLQTIDVPIPTLGTFFKDVRYLDVARKVIQELLVPGDPHSKVSIDEEVIAQHRRQASSRAAARRGLQELWRFAFRHGHEMTGTRRQVPRGRTANQRTTRPRYTDGNGPVDRAALWRHFFWLAEQQGFTIPAHATSQRDPGLVCFPEPPDDNNQDEPLSRRCGRPFADSADADRFALSGEALAQQTDEIRRVTPGLVRQSQFRAFFRHLAGGSETRQSIDLSPDPPGTTAPAIDDPADTPGDDHEATMSNSNNVSTQSPGIPRSIFPDHSGFFEFPGLDFLPDLPGPSPATRFSVQVCIPHCQPKNISLPNEENVIQRFYQGLKEREFVFYTGNRNIRQDTHFYSWHCRVPSATVKAVLSRNSVQASETSEANMLKRQRVEPREEPFNTISCWVDNQKHEVEAIWPIFPSADMNEEDLWCS